MKKFLLAHILFSFFCIFGAHAENLVWHKLQGKTELIYTLFTENGFWNVNLYSVKPGELQELQWHKAYSTEKKAKKFLSQFLTANEMQFPHNENGAEYIDRNYSLTEEPTESVWKTENQWSWEWEKKYSQWLSENYTKELFIQNNISVDCADNATAIRWIFSRIFKLPEGNRLAGTGVLFTNESMKDEWKKLPTHEDWRKDLRFLKALEYVLDNTYTHTMFRDGYPIALNKDAFMAGIYMIDLQGETGHTRVVSYVSYEKNGQVPLRVLQSTAPKKLQYLSESPFWESPPVRGDSEMLKSRWPIKVSGKWELVPAEKMPHYSLEQFDPKFPGEHKDFTLAIYKRLMPDFDPVKLVSEGVEETLKKFQRRNKAVNEGYEFCKKSGCPEGTKEWEDWSTPMLDKSILDYVGNLEKVSGLIGERSPEAKQVWTEGINLKTVPILQYHTPTIKQLLFIWRYNLFDSNPNVPPAQRWALDPTETLKAMTYRIKSLLKERVEKVAKSTCDHCGKDSKEWKESNTYQIDSDIQRYYIGVIQYCEIFVVNCDSFRQDLREQSWTLGDVTMNLPLWLERSLWFNSDPRTSTEMRWGKIHNEVVPIHGLVGPKTLVSKNEILLGGDLESRQLVDLRARKNIALPNGFVIEDLEMTQGLGLLINQISRQIGILEPSTNRFSTLKVNFVPAKAMWFSSKVIVGKTSTAGKMFAVKFENGKFSNLIEIETTSDEANRLVSDRHQIIEYSDPSLQMKPKDIFFVSHEKNRYTLYDFTSTELKTTVIKHVFPSELPSENLRGITHVSKTHYLLRVVTVDARCPQDRPDCDSQSQVSYAVNKADGKVSRYDYYVGKLLAADKYTIEKAGKKADEQGVFVVTVDEAFQIKKQSAKMGSYFHYNAGPYAHLWAGEGYSGELLRIKTDGSFELITKTSAAMYPSFLSGDVALMNLSSGGGIYDLSAKKLIFSTPWIEKGDGYLTDKSAFFYAGEATQAALYRISDKSDVPLVTGLSAFLGQRQSCARFFNMRIGAYTEFDRVAHSEYGGRDCNGDRNFSDGVLFYMTGGRAYYIPSTLTGITIHGFFERNLIHTPKIY